MKVTVDIPDEIVEQYLDDDRDVDAAVVEDLLVCQESEPGPEVYEWVRDKHGENLTKEPRC